MTIEEFFDQDPDVRHYEIALVKVDSGALDVLLSRELVDPSTTKRDLIALRALAAKRGLVCLYEQLRRRLLIEGIYR